MDSNTPGTRSVAPSTPPAGHTCVDGSAAVRTVLRFGYRPSATHSSGRATLALRAKRDSTARQRTKACEKKRSSQSGTHSTFGTTTLTR
jgi:hypothetical protein